ncbi:MAG: hypothetical protein HYY48_01110 [Gammaproteobacteria bacterium]|nr:hypothetical protein [Gammaproteobacteria bacterium]
MNDIDNLFSELRRTEPYLSDAGFASAVMAQVPRRRELPMWVKNLLLLSATVAGSAVVAWQLPAVELVSLITSMKLSLQTFAAAAITVYLFSYGAIWVAEKNN